MADYLSSLPPAAVRSLSRSLWITTSYFPFCPPPRPLPLPLIRLYHSSMVRGSRHSIAPYDLMSVGTAPDPNTTSEPRSDLTDAVPEKDLPWNGWPFTQWLARLGHPIVVRIPRGFAVLIAIGILGLIVLSYQVGYARKSLQARTSQNAGTIEPRSLLPPTRPVANVPSKRTKGLNYLMMTTFPPKAPDNGGEHQKEAERLIRYLRQQAVAATIEITDNGLLRVVDLKGFRDDQMAGEKYNAHKNKLNRLGRIWKSEHNGAREFSVWPLKW